MQKSRSGSRGKSGGSQSPRSRSPRSFARNLDSVPDSIASPSKKGVAETKAERQERERKQRAFASGDLAPGKDDDNDGPEATAPVSMNDSVVSTPKSAKHRSRSVPGSQHESKGEPSSLSGNATSPRSSQSKGGTPLVRKDSRSSAKASSPRQPAPRPRGRSRGPNDRSLSAQRTGSSNAVDGSENTPRGKDSSPRRPSTSRALPPRGTSPRGAGRGKPLNGSSSGPGVRPSTGPSGEGGSSSSTGASGSGGPEASRARKSRGKSAPAPTNRSAAANRAHERRKQLAELRKAEEAALAAEAEEALAEAEAAVRSANDETIKGADQRAWEAAERLAEEGSSRDYKGIEASTSNEVTARPDDHEERTDATKENNDGNAGGDEANSDSHAAAHNEGVEPPPGYDDDYNMTGGALVDLRAVCQRLEKLKLVNVCRSASRGRGSPRRRAEHGGRGDSHSGVGVLGPHRDPVPPGAATDDDDEEVDDLDGGLGSHDGGWNLGGGTVHSSTTTRARVPLPPPGESSRGKQRVVKQQQQAEAGGSGSLRSEATSSAVLYHSGNSSRNKALQAAFASPSASKNDASARDLSEHSGGKPNPRSGGANRRPPAAKPTQSSHPNKGSHSAPESPLSPLSTAALATASSPSPASKGTNSALSTSSSATPAPLSPGLVTLLEQSLINPEEHGLGVLLSGQFLVRDLEDLPRLAGAEDALVACGVRRFLARKLATLAQQAALEAITSAEGGGGGIGTLDPSYALPRYQDLRDSPQSMAAARASPLMIAKPPLPSTAQLAAREAGKEMTTHLLQEEATMWAAEESRATTAAAAAGAPIEGGTLGAANTSRRDGHPLVASPHSPHAVATTNGANATSPVLLFSPHLAPPNYSNQASPSHAEESSPPPFYSAAAAGDIYDDQGFGSDLETTTPRGESALVESQSETPPMDVTVAFIQRQRLALAANDSAAVVQPLTLTEPELFVPPPSAANTRGRGRAVEVDPATGKKKPRSWFSRSRESKSKSKSRSPREAAAAAEKKKKKDRSRSRSRGFLSRLGPKLPESKSPEKDSVTNGGDDDDDDDEEEGLARNFACLGNNDDEEEEDELAYMAQQAAAAEAAEGGESGGSNAPHGGGSSSGGGGGQAPVATSFQARKLVTTANQLAGSHDYDGALDAYHQALHMYDALNLDHANKVASLEEMVTAAASRSDGAAFVLYSGKHAEEEGRQMETLKDTAKTLNNLAAVLHQLRRFDDAMRAYERALDAKRSSLGPDHFSVGHTLYNLACLQLDNENPEAAAHFMRETLVIYEVAFGPTHQLTKDVEKQLFILEAGLADQAYDELMTQNKSDQGSIERGDGGKSGSEAKDEYTGNSTEHGDGKTLSELGGIDLDPASGTFDRGSRIPPKAPA